MPAGGSGEQRDTGARLAAPGEVRDRFARAYYEALGEDADFAAALLALFATIERILEGAEDPGAVLVGSGFRRVPRRQEADAEIATFIARWPLPPAIVDADLRSS